MNKLIATLALTTALAVPAGAAEFGEWDSDGDGTISRAEFDAGVADAEFFNRFDADTSGSLDTREFGELTYSAMDADADGTVTLDEWDTYVDRTYGEEPVDLSVAAWDDDGDGVISRAEFEEQTEGGAAIGEHDLNDDTLYDPEEVDEALFNFYDTDEDLVLDDEEFSLTDLLF